MTADDPALAERLRFAVQGCYVALWRRHEFVEQIDIVFLLDQMLGNPQGVFVRLQHHAELAFRRDEPISATCVLAPVNGFLANPPVICQHSDGFNDADDFLRRIEPFPRGRIRPMQGHPVDRIQAEVIKKFPAILATQILRQEEVHEMMGGNRQPVRQVPVQGCQHSLA